ncbi:MAG: hypothetical protein K0S56_2228 [Microvirga sp.]|jgi:hypothetical protein|nr:hypothetical protein [Microvirga sp.]
MVLAAVREAREDAKNSLSTLRQAMQERRERERKADRERRADEERAARDEAVGQAPQAAAAR